MSSKGNNLDLSGFYTTLMVFIEVTYDSAKVGAVTRNSAPRFRNATFLEFDQASIVLYWRERLSRST